MSGRILDIDPQTGIVRTFHYNEADETFTISTDQHVEDTVELTKAQYNGFDERTPWKGDTHKIASIPLTLFFQLRREGVIDPEHDPRARKLTKWLNDSDNRVFRTRPGRV